MKASEMKRSLERLRERLAGPLIMPGHSAYDQVRKPFNDRIDYRPEAIAQVQSRRDVIEAVRFAREYDFDLSVRAGGHGVLGHSTAGRLVIDLTALQSLRIDKAARVSTAGAGVLWHSLDVAAHQHGLATPGARISHIGVAGFTLGGGEGWLSRRHGLAADNLVAAELVTADGEVHTAGHGQNSELLWALQGGGGNFGVVTSLSHRLHETQPALLAGQLVYPGSRAAEVTRRFAEFVHSAPDETGTSLAYIAVPPGSPLPDELHGKSAVVITLVLSSDEFADRILRPLRDRALGPVADSIGPVAYPGLQMMLDAHNSFGFRVHSAAVHLPAITGATVNTVVSLWQDRPAQRPQIILVPTDGAISRVPTSATAFGKQRQSWSCYLMTRWTDPRDDEPNIAWIHSVKNALTPTAGTGSYLNMDDDHSEQAVRAAFGERNYGRLALIKQKWDPCNVFRHNANVVPARPFREEPAPRIRREV